MILEHFLVRQLPAAASGGTSSHPCAAPRPSWAPWEAAPWPGGQVRHFPAVIFGWRTWRNGPFALTWGTEPSATSSVRPPRRLLFLESGRSDGDGKLAEELSGDEQSFLPRDVSCGCVCGRGQASCRWGRGAAPGQGRGLGIGGAAKPPDWDLALPYISINYFIFDLHLACVALDLGDRRWWRRPKRELDSQLGSS